MGDLQLVRQEHGMGCTVATAAMILGVTYQEALAAFEFDEPDHFHKHGLSQDWLDMLVWHRGFVVQKLHRKRLMSMAGWSKKWREPWPPAPFAPLHYCLVIPWENAPGHSVVMLADGSVLDPASDAPKRLADYHEVWTVTGVWPVRAAIAKSEA